MKSAILFLSFIVAGGAFAFWVAGVLPSIGEQPRELVKAPRETASAPAICGVGYVEPVSEIRNLTFKIDGVIEKCPVQVGQSMKVGEILSALQNRDEQSAVDVAERELLLAKADREKLLSGVHPSEQEAAQRRVAALEANLKFYQKR
jgi:multidrug efflux pump subunit AcrA (membrane-fusion protein)